MQEYRQPTVGWQNVHLQYSNIINKYKFGEAHFSYF